MRGVGHIDAIESATFRHAEGNKGEKIGVKRGIGGFYGVKLLKRQVRGQPREEGMDALTWATRQVAGGEDIGGRLIELDVETPGSKGDGSLVIAGGLYIFHQDAVFGNF